MIHAQRPNASACAPMEVWNKPMNRFVKRGSKGIALLDNSSDKSKLKYVFDVADTQDGRYNSRSPFLWQLQHEHNAPVWEALDKAYNVSDWSNSSENMGDMLFGLAASLAARYYEDNRHDIAYAVEDSFLAGYDEFNVSVAYKGCPYNQHRIYTYDTLRYRPIRVYRG